MHDFKVRIDRGFNVETLSVSSSCTDTPSCSAISSPCAWSRSMRSATPSSADLLLGFLPWNCVRALLSVKWELLGNSLMKAGKGIASKTSFQKSVDGSLHDTTFQGSFPRAAGSSATVSPGACTVSDSGLGTRIGFEGKR